MRLSGARPIIVAMDGSSSLHRIEDDLSETWVEELVEVGLQAIEAYLAKHVAFQRYLGEASA